MKGATNFAGLTDKQKTVWSRDVWSSARDQAFVSRFLGKGANAMIQRITELTKTEKGEKALMFLVADLQDDGGIGDDEREGNEEAMTAHELEIVIDLINHGVKNKGKLSDQKTVIRFRETAKDKLSYWLANRIDQLAFLTMSGVSYAYNTDGSARTSSAFANLAFAADVSAPTTNRHRRWTGSAMVAGDTTAIVATDLPNYKMIVDAIAYAKDHYIKPLMQGGKEYYVLLVKPGTLAALKKDSDYIRAVTSGMQRGKSNPFFTGGVVTIDGAVIHEHRMTYNTKGAASGSKWGADGTIDGTRTLLCGAQALGMADLGNPEWNEKEFQYGSQKGINVDKMFGYIKPKFYSDVDGGIEDFGLLAIDHYLQ